MAPSVTGSRQAYREEGLLWHPAERSQSIVLACSFGAVVGQYVMAVRTQQGMLLLPGAGSQVRGGVWVPVLSPNLLYQVLPPQGSSDSCSVTDWRPSLVVEAFSDPNSNTE